MLDVSVVIPVRDGSGHLPGLFAALDSQTLAPDRFEVVLVDDGSTDNSREIAAAWAASDPEHRRLVLREAGGPARARNAGIAEARGTWVASTDCDIHPDPRWLEAALEALELTGAHAVEGAIDVQPGAATGVSGVRQLNPDGGRYMTGNMVYRRDLLQQLGGFDERFEEQLLEDSDLAFRIQDAGYEIPFAPAARVSHPLVSLSTRDVLRNTRRLRWLALLAGKHPERYRRQLRPHVRPLTAIDIDVLVGLGALVGLRRARGIGRLMLAAVAANGLKRGLVSAGVTAPPREHAPRRALLAFAAPPLRAFWWLVGCVRFRKFFW